VFDETEVSPLLRLLFPSYTSLIPAAGASATAVIPFGGRFLMHLVRLSCAPGYQSDQNGLLEYMLARHLEYTDVNEAKATPAILLLLAILSKSNGKISNMTPDIFRHIQHRKGFRAIWRFLIAEYSGDPEVVFTVLRDVCLSSDPGNSPYQGTHSGIYARLRTRNGFLLASTLALLHCVQTTSICTLAVDDWDAGPGTSISVLQFLCETFRDPPWENTVRHFNHQGQRRRPSHPWKRNTAHSRDQRIHLARVCLLGLLQARIRADGDTPIVIADEDKIDHVTMLNALTLLSGDNASESSDCGELDEFTSESSTDAE
jgi:hypothetical protein